MISTIKLFAMSVLPKYSKRYRCGDVVILETGEEIPADGELLEAVSLHVNESTLTGEPMAQNYESCRF